MMADQKTYQAVESFLIGRACKSQSHGHATAGDNVNFCLAKRNKVIEKKILATTITYTVHTMGVQHGL